MNRTKKSMKAGLTKERQLWLCQKNQIERTIQLLSFLNYWAKSKNLATEDRQRLYKIKAKILEAAFKEGHISAIKYLDGLPKFLDNFKEWETIEDFIECSRNTLLERQRQQKKAVDSFPGRPTKNKSPKKVKCPKCPEIINELLKRVNHWKLEHHQTFLKSNDVYWVLFGRRKKKKPKLNFINLPLPDAKIYPKLTKAQAKQKRRQEEEGLTFKRPITPAWSIEIIEKFALENQELINKIEAEILAQEERTFNELVRRWEKGKNTIIKKQENQKTKLASLLDISTAELKQLIHSKTELIKILTAWFKKHFYEAVENRQPLDINSLDTLGILPDQIFEYDAIDPNEELNLEFDIFWDNLDPTNLGDSSY